MTINNNNEILFDIIDKEKLNETIMNRYYENEILLNEYGFELFGILHIPIEHILNEMKMK